MVDFGTDLVVCPCFKCCGFTFLFLPQIKTTGIMALFKLNINGGAFEVDVAP